MSLNIDRVFRSLHDFDFAGLLVKELRWSPPVSEKTMPIDRGHSRHEIARYAGVPVFEVTSASGAIPNLRTRDALCQAISPLFPRRLLIFIDRERTRSVWHWLKHERSGVYRREYVYAKGQPEDVLLSKLNTIVADIVQQTENRLSKGTSGVSQRASISKIYKEFINQRRRLAQSIRGIDTEADRNLYATVLLNRLILLYFLQQRGFIEQGNSHYLEDALRKSQHDCYYEAFLLPLFFEGLSMPVHSRTAEIQALLGNVIYLGGVLFQPQPIERQHTAIHISDSVFEQLFSFFSRYTWQIVEAPVGEREDTKITPEVLVSIFEMYYNQVSGVGLSSTPPEMSEYLCRQTIHQVIVEKVRSQVAHVQQATSGSLEEMLATMDAEVCRRLLFEVLPDLTMLDPACGSGAFLVAALNALVTIYSEAIGRIAFFNDDALSRWLHVLHQKHHSALYYLKKSIITNNLYGVDIREDAIEMTRLQLYLSLIASARSAFELEPFSDIDFHLTTGDSLVGFHAHEEIGEPAGFDWRHVYPQIIERQDGFDVIITNPPWETDLYQRFLEQSYNLLPSDGYCGIVVPHGLYTDASMRRVRELLFNKTRLTGLFCFTNSRKILEGLDRRIKFDLLTFKKGNSTKVFPAAFDRENAEELEHFPEEGAVLLTTEFIRRFSPDSLALANFKSQRDVRICEKMLRFPHLGENLVDSWNIKFVSGLSRPVQADVAMTEPGLDTVALYEGRMIQQFTHTFTPPRFWFDTQSNIRFSRQLVNQKQSGYHGYRLGVRYLTANTNERTLIATVLRPDILISDTIIFTSNALEPDVLLFLTAILNSFIADFFVRLSVSFHVAVSTIYQLPIPRLTRQDKGFLPIMKRAARLVCTTPECKELWEAAMSESWLPEMAATSFVERNQLRAELDGLIAHLYTIKEEEFTYILRTFPLVADPIKIAAQNAYRDVERGLIV